MKIRPRIKARIPRAVDKLHGPISFGLSRDLRVRKHYRKAPEGFPAIERRMDASMIDAAYIVKHQQRIRKLLDSMPWSEIEDAMKHLPKEIRRKLRYLAENGRIR